MKIEVYKTVREWVNGIPEEVIRINTSVDAKQKSMEYMKNRYYSCVVRQDDGNTICKYIMPKNRKGNFRCYISLKDMYRELSRVVSTAGSQYAASGTGDLYLETKGLDFIVSQSEGKMPQSVDMSGCIWELSLVEKRIKELGFKCIDYLKFRKRSRLSYKEIWVYSSEENPGYAVIETC